ncbi:hypothetical protein SAMN04487770_12012 [Butyrivibrio sp. ob235]|uniref:hypothetical protein n=1 Tax=Butyrivibrio sp. ob235 TaxID=1761780 RepID=UPI0008BE8805|nr:hypothetical protein [Butyrivibrio sp. ob235]SEL89235.1 hypothetical protein SAMN04487770_12012 [Butyrivibrio sp. ob235]
MKKENLFKRIVATVLTTAMVVGAAVVSPAFGTDVHAENFTETTLQLFANAEDGASAPALFTMPCKLEEEGENERGYAKEAKGYFKFTLAQDAWVYFTSSTSSDRDKQSLSSRTKIYGDPNFSNQVAEFEDPYFTDAKNDTAFLKKGTYYGYVYAHCDNWDYFEGNVNVIGYGVPIASCFQIKQKKKHKKTIVTINNALGRFSKYMQCVPKGVGSQSLYNDRVWKDEGKWHGDDKTKVLDCNENDQFTFTVKKKSKKYTVMLEDINGKRYQKTFKVKVKK